jgi:leucyl/phenylalanyl-tRNA--protein transferase
LAAPHFPPVERADSSGLLMLGGELAPEWLLEAYSHGIFPWPLVEARHELLAWFSPDPRAILELDGLYVSRRLRRRLRRGEFHFTADRAFADVVAGCAMPRSAESGVWITQSLGEAFVEFHQRGHAHSIEVWQDDRLVGGIYGVSIGGYFAGESMFHRVRDASKAAMAVLVARLRRQGFRLFDVQLSTPHLESLGAKTIPRDEFLRRLQSALQAPTNFGPAGDIELSLVY